MQIFKRNGDCDLVAHYEYFLMHYNWTQTSLPDQIGDWELLGGVFVSDSDGPVRLSAVYRTGEETDAQIVFIELAEDLLMKMVVGNSLAEISPELPPDVLDQVQNSGDDLASKWKSFNC